MTCTMLMTWLLSILIPISFSALLSELSVSECSQPAALPGPWSEQQCASLQAEDFGKADRQKKKQTKKAKSDFLLGSETDLLGKNSEGQSKEAMGASKKR